MKKVFVCLLVMVMVCLTIFNTGAAEAVAEMNRYDTASLSDFPDLVTDKTIQEHKLLERRKDDEGQSLNTLAYCKEDGQNVAFVYPYNVKYTDSKGNIKDKSKDIVKDGLFSANSYKTQNNDILSYFSVNSDGNVEVKTTYGEYSVISVMQSRNRESKMTSYMDDDDGNLIYTNAVDTGIHLMYEAQYNGVKEYIVIDERGLGGNKYAFTMTFDGLTPQLTEGGAVLLLDSKEETVLTIPAVYAKDSAENPNYTYDNAVTLAQIDINTYVYEITVDTAFLKSKDTVYPVYVDPSTTIYETAIEDACVSELSPSTRLGSYQFMNVGHAESTAGKHYYAYVKFNDLPTEVSHHNILSAYYETYEVRDTDASVLAVVMPASDEWSASTLKWENQPYYHAEIIAKQQVGRNSAPLTPDFGERGRYRFYISNMVRGWVQGLPNYGVVIKCDIDTGFIRLASCENQGTATPPCLVIVYVNDTVELDLSIPNDNNQFYIKNKRSGLYLTALSTTTDENVYQADFDGSANQKWELESLGSGYYKIKLAGTNYVLDVYWGSTAPTGNTNGANIQTFGSGSGDNQKWKFIRNWNGTYQILSKLSNDTKGLTVLNASLADEANCVLWSHNVNFSYNDDWTIEPVNVGKVNLYSFTEDNYDGVETATTMNGILESIEEMNISTDNIINHVNNSAENGLNTLTNSSAWYYAGHGGDSLIQFKNEDGVRSNLNANHIYSLTGNSLNNLYLLGTNSCSTGNSQDYDNDDANDDIDFVGVAYRRGAHFVFASPNVTHEGPNNLWTETFILEVVSGSTYYDAIQTADTAVWNDYGATLPFEAQKTISRHYAGDVEIALYH